MQSQVRTDVWSAGQTGLAHAGRWGTRSFCGCQRAYARSSHQSPGCLLSVLPIVDADVTGRQLLSRTSNRRSNFAMQTPECAQLPPAT